MASDKVKRTDGRNMLSEFRICGSRFLRTLKTSIHLPSPPPLFFVGKDEFVWGLHLEGTWCIVTGRHNGRERGG